MSLFRRFSRASIIAPGLILMAAQNLPAGDWTQFRGPGGNGLSPEKGLVTQWSEGKNVAWQIDLPGPGSSSPIVVGNKVFVTCYSGYGVDTKDLGELANLTRHLLCVDLGSGKVLWEKTVTGGPEESVYEGFIRQHGYASSTPASDGQHVYVFYGKSGVLAYDLDGNELWKTSLGTGDSFQNWGSATSPIVVDDLVIVNAAAEAQAMIALDKKTGKQVWKSDGEALHSSWATPVIVETQDGRKEIVVSAPNELWGFDPKAGKLLWYAGGVVEDTITASAVPGKGIVYAMGGRSGSAVAIRAGGQDDSTKSHQLWTGKVQGGSPSPTLVGNRIYGIADGGVLTCLDAESGKEISKTRVQGAKGVYASPIAADGHLYIVTRKTGTFVLSLAGDQPELIATNLFASDDTDFNASPAVADGKLILRSNKRLYCVGSK